MTIPRKLAALAAVPLLWLAIPATPAFAHGYVNSPASRQANCARGVVTGCGEIQWEPQSVEGPKGLRRCDGGNTRFAQLSDETRNWPTTSVGQTVAFTWTLTARHATSSWQYYLGSELLAQVNDGGAQPGATVTHQVSMRGHTGRQKVLAIWNIADTPNAFYACIDLQVR
ncbi:lytic polysaccharide monooxygenase auxiliary activity family 9 protein [Actinokineospora bangkokensis]|uniref:Chitin-binding protein n=1 Tax=Actinokineospora bangkokensis TaxID=1193682 RepID=A0A1Q9LJ96_9PSEU|nr:lytic polysaccharide monooxygenase auxiliary activity family 9 protein [Actinokineospora bangkokensis]OLR92122.1 chitin-binding protein [Actinokineospora bangkokensis]